MKVEKRNKFILKRISAILVLCALVLAFCATALAAGTIDKSRTGSVTVEMEYGGDVVTGGTLAIYYVGEVAYGNGGYYFALTDDFDDFTGAKSYTESEALTDDVADAIYEYVVENSLSAYQSKVNITGTVVFSGLKVGLYLVVQTQASTGYEAFLPFLITVPMYDDGEYEYNVTAYAKFSLVGSVSEEETTSPEEETTSPSEEETTSPSEEETTSPSEEETTSPSEEETTSPSEEETTTSLPEEEETTSPSEEETTTPSEEETTPSEEETTPEEETTTPDEETTTPDEPTLPQTGSSNWLIPVMAGVGIVLFILGWILKYGRRKKER